MLRNCNCSNELEEISKNDKVKDDLEIDLALLQHYGASTRCIDFSKNIKVALYFATCDWDSPDCVDGSIYITNFLFHKPQWFTNYFVNYVAKFNNKNIIDWNFSHHFMNLSTIEKEFRRAGKPFDLYNVTTEIRYYLSQEFLFDFIYLNKYDKRITNQEGALFHYPSQFYYTDHESKEKFKCENNNISISDIRDPNHHICRSIKEIKETYN